MISAFLTALVKDLKLIAKHRSSLILVLSAPILIAILIGGMYSEPTGEVKGKIPILVCDLDGSNLSMNFARELEQMFITAVAYDDCSEIAKKSIEDGFFRTSIILPQDFEANVLSGKSSELIYFYDNTDISLRLISRTMVVASVHRLSKTIGREFISGIWGELRTLSDGIEEAQQEINSSESDLRNLKANVIELKESMSQVNWDFYIFLTEHTVNISGEAIIRIESLQGHLRSITDESEALEDELQNITPGILDTAPLIETLTNFINSSTGVEEMFQELKTNISLLKSSLEHSLDELRTLKNLSDSTSAEIDESIELIDHYIARLEDLREKSAQTKARLESITSTEPENILTPAYLSEQDVFPQKMPLEAMAPFIVSVVIMLVCLLLSSSSLVRERSSGTLTRSLISPTPSSLLLISKIISVLIVGLVEGTLLLLFSHILFSVSVPLTLELVLSLALTSAAFSSLGLVLAVFSKTETVATLSSLVLAIPMLFLAGFIQPFEMMEEPIRSIALSMPLSQSVLILKSIIIYELKDVFTSSVIVGNQVLVMNSGLILFAYAFGCFLLAYVLLTRIFKK